MTTDNFFKWISDKVTDDDISGLRNGLQNIAELSSAESNKIVASAYKWWTIMAHLAKQNKGEYIASMICIDLDVTKNKSIRKFKNFKIVLV